MNALVILLFISVFLAEFVVKNLGIGNQYLVLVPELLSGVAVLVLLNYLLAGRRWSLDMRYWIVLALYFFVVIFGFFAQQMPAGAIVSGMRNYLKFLPFFLLPVVYPFTPKQLATQLAALFVILAVQSPLAVFQRFVQFADSMHTGDPVVGLTTSSGVLSILMMGGVAAAVALYLRRAIKFRTMLFAVAVFVLPTTLNETKATLFLLPVALLAPAFFMPRGSGALRRLVPIGLVGMLAGTAFVTGYNYFIQTRDDAPPIGTFVTEEGRAQSYLYSGAADGKERYIGRLDSVVIAVRRLADDPLSLAFGLGAGNVSAAPLRGFDGEYAAYFDRFGVGHTQVTTFIWEIGIVGLAVFLWLCTLLVRDARYLARQEGAGALVGQIWGTVIIMIVMTLLYVSIFAINEIAYFFWFYAGVLASAAARARRAAFSAAQAARAPPRWYVGDDPLDARAGIDAARAG